ncbi:MAG: aspartate/glutamate racemase family protein [Acidobacteriota bacterium]
MKQRKTIGILGGMGPEATSYMFQLIIKHTKAEKDQEHAPVIVVSHPHIPPRTDAILGKGPDPTPFIIEAVSVLKKAGADFIIMPCITAHYFLPKITNQSPLPFLNLLNETALWVKNKLPEVKKLGLISSSGTISSRLFHRALAEEGLAVIHPQEERQRLVMEAIFGPSGIKAGQTEGPPKDIIIKTARALIERGAQAIIAGCTEVPIVLKQEDISAPLVEPMKIGALKAIKTAGLQAKE